MSASNFPRLLDNDVNLHRVISTDALVPPHINNHTDALEAIEPTVGICDDGTAYGAGGTFSRGLTDHAGLMTTDGPNGRHPWVPRSAAAFYGTDNGIPGAWTVPSGLSIAFGPPRGPMHWTAPADATTRFAWAALSGASVWEAVLRCRVGGKGASWSAQFGLGTDGGGSDISGVIFQSTSGPHYQTAGTDRGAIASFDDSAGLRFWHYWRVRMDGTTFTLYWSPDAGAWDEVATLATAITPTKVLLATQGSVATAYDTPDLWVDFIATGNTAPQGN